MPALSYLCPRRMSQGLSDGSAPRRTPRNLPIILPRAAAATRAPIRDAKPTLKPTPFSALSWCDGELPSKPAITAQEIPFLARQQMESRPGPTPEPRVADNSLEDVDAKLFRRLLFPSTSPSVSPNKDAKSFRRLLFPSTSPSVSPNKSESVTQQGSDISSTITNALPLGMSRGGG